MTQYKLYAEYDERHLIGCFHSLTAAANKVAKMEDDEEWPDGHDAVVVDQDGIERALVDDNWELIT